MLVCRDRGEQQQLMHGGGESGLTEGREKPEGVLVRVQASTVAFLSEKV